MLVATLNRVKITILCCFLGLIVEKGFTGQNVSAASLSGNLQVVVNKIIDGDSLMASYGSEILEIRLWGIDSPEYDQPGSKGSKRKLKGLILGRKADLLIKDKDRYGRHVAVLFSNGTNINEEMISSGNSWVHVYYCREPICRKWKELEEQARKDKRGIWKDKNPIPPWQWKAKR